MKNKTKIIALILVLIFIQINLIISGYFYWFMYRPSEVKKDCTTAAVKQRKETENKWGQFAQLDYLQNVYKDTYDSCLSSKGL